MTIALIHLTLVLLWFGLVIAETSIELLARKNEEQVFLSKVHYFIDKYIEIPFILGILFTGVALIIHHWPLNLLHWIKIICGLIAIGFNFYCFSLVKSRYQNMHQPQRMRAYSKKMRIVTLSFPFGLAAFYIGIKYFFI